MADEKNYVSVLDNGSGQDLYIRDEEAHEDIADLQETVNNRVDVTITQHTAVFANAAAVSGSTLVLTT